MARNTPLSPDEIVKGLDAHDSPTLLVLPTTRAMVKAVLRRANQTDTLLVVDPAIISSALDPSHYLAICRQAETNGELVPVPTPSPTSSSTHFVTCPFCHLLLALTLALPLTSLAQSPVRSAAATTSEPVQLDTVIVTGTMPAPGLWEFTRDSKRVLIMGTLTPAPRGMTWYSPTVESRMAQAQEVLGPPGVSVSTDVGFFGGLMLMPSFRRSKKNPDGKRLQDVLPPTTYARWQAAKARYLGSDRGVEELRPVHAAKTLFDAAVRQVGLSDEDRVDPVIRRIAREQDIPVRSTVLRLTIKDPEKTLRQFSATSLNDVPCLEQTLDRLNIDLQTMLTRANAWAEGDVKRLRELPFNDQKKACLGALASNEIARAQGIDNLDTEILDSWKKALHASLTAHDVVFATIPIGRLEGAGGVLEVLRAEGFAVKAPE